MVSSGYAPDGFQPTFPLSMGILQAKIRSIPSSRIFQLRDQAQVSHVADGFFTESPQFSEYLECSQPFLQGILLTQESIVVSTGRYSLPAEQQKYYGWYSHMKRTFKGCPEDEWCWVGSVSLENLVTSLVLLEF